MSNVVGQEDKGTIVVKIGGSTLGNEDSSLKDVVNLQKQGFLVVVVHGGGTIITEWMQKQGISPMFVQGLRITDPTSMEIVTAVLAGLVNKNLVASLHTFGGQALGISGVDGWLLQASILDEKLGLVGKVDHVNAKLIQDLLERGYVPVISPIGVNVSKHTAQQGWLLNINGDTAAGEIAAALEAEHLIFLTDVDGILDSRNNLIRKLNRKQIADLREEHVIQGGMLPKVEAALTALEKGTITRIVDGRVPGALLTALDSASTGTVIS